ncbi:TIGR03619 family F420-dependent LLM class oxidoreductase [Roseomonas sp. NAR14]|uniref:TIGR03619 family F420-dependent LLM class oxidoreductase n=1 Tax=Roseomonas acroporae TaxID=2937791 RepID=A0A9X1YBK1_9PROT|nr:TIGR03619 family F420-dependent LLM class oxidoreductase [Roseomonas acroporae]MCK8785687.1 TIGR03619 family F420-dependent LLM class oxidoreductase [Roseomonas acroporae]
MIVSAGLPTGMEGLTYPVPFAGPEGLLRIARHAEALGYHSVWGNDHMTTQHYVREEYPDTPPRFWEPLVTYAWLAAQTTTLRFGTGVVVLPMRRDIVVLAKQLCTLDHLSGGRLEVGLGIGAYLEEFRALQPDVKLQRGEIVDEGLAALGKLLTERVASFEGRYFRYRDVELTPKPLQKRLPIYVGGNNPNNIRRAVEYGDGWLPAALPAETLAEGVALLRRLAGEAGRDPATIEVAPQFIVHLGRTQEAASARFRQSQMHRHLVSLRKSTLKDQAGADLEAINLIGTPEEVIRRAIRLREAGVTHLLGLYFAANSVQELLDQMQLFAEEVMPHIV